MNFGHTYGHAIEAINNYRKVLHGEAVAMGMRMASKMSMLEGHLNEKTYNRIINVFDALNFPRNISSNYSDLKKYILNDKKVKGGSINLILLKGIGLSFQTQKFNFENFKKSFT